MLLSPLVSILDRGFISKREVNFLRPLSGKDFITRGGFLRMDRSLAMFSGILDLLRNLEFYQLSSQSSRTLRCLLDVQI